MKSIGHKFFNVYSDKKNNLFTLNLTPGKSFFAEKLVRDSGKEFREWDANRSKLAAAIKKKISQIGIRKGSVVLYLGASHGYTPSFISDIVGSSGFIFCLDFAPRVVRDLVFVCEERSNMAPMLESANHPQDYASVVGQVDVVYMDIAQREQTKIFVKNIETFLKKDGFGLLALKARSVDVTKKPKIVFKQVYQELENTKGISVVDYRELAPYELDHAFFVVKKK
ncbi:fibrillarin-like rRNA/tRNA 2'-O-methyltransferase [Candidatus Woesearchaeota archaeon]|nr:fibrillarin-like rRNA/tRNA 2'-O-methyltransferase [Candidatus Woesearchaeota archaeon]